MKIFNGISILLILWCAFGSGQEIKPYTITDVQRAGDNFIISYSHTPIGDEEGAEYEVVFRLTRESVKGFSQDMEFVSGAVGDGKFVGNNLRVIWAYKKQFPRGLPYDDIEFELTISKNEGIGSWVWYTGGAAVLGAGAVLLLGSSKDEASSDGPLPGPPTSRPN
ncbi:MAG: hypothetical protein HYV29_13505 [Ignavibacteriales bacterium]|nr:hypothetical protein [Ignavibacteriales bacterium]